MSLHLNLNPIPCMLHGILAWCNAESYSPMQSLIFDADIASCLEYEACFSYLFNSGLAMRPAPDWWTEVT